MEARYKVLTQDDLRARQEEDTHNVSELLSIAPGLAAVLLRHCHWSPERVQRGWFDNGEALRVVVGLPPSEEDVSGPKVLTRGKPNCLCFDDVDGAVRAARSVGCSHYYCDECWRSYIRVTDGPQCLSLRCQDPSCKVPVVRELVVEVAHDTDTVALYDQFMLRSYVDDSGGRIKWCRGCSRAVEFLGGGGGNGESTDVFCECRHGFCWRCGGEPHRPVVSCDAARAWLDGKNRSPEDELLENALREVDEVKRFVSGFRLGEMACHLDFLTEAFEEIAECRRRIRWVYAYCDLEPHGNRCEIFARLLIDANGSIERLEACARDERSKLSDAATEAISHTCSSSETRFVIDLTSGTRQHMVELLKTVETTWRQHWIGDSAIDSAATPTLSHIWASSTSVSPAIRPRQAPSQLRIQALEAQLEEERRQRLEYEVRMEAERRQYETRMEAERTRIEAERAAEQQRMADILQYMQTLGTATGVARPPALFAPRPPPPPP